MKTYENTASIEDTLLGLAYEATGIIFPQMDSGIHPLVPDSLRELQQVMAFFDDLIGEKGAQNSCSSPHLNGIRKFRSFLLEYWINNNLKKENELLIKEFEGLDIKEKNKFLVQQYHKIIRSKSTTENFKSVEGNPVIERLAELEAELFSLKNYYFHVSIGDVLACFQLLKKYFPTKESRNLNFAFASLLTLDMQEAFLRNRPKDVQKIINGRGYNKPIHYPDPGTQSKILTKLTGLPSKPFHDTGSTLGDFGKGLSKGGNFEQKKFQQFELLHLFLFLQDSKLDDEKAFRGHPIPFYEKEARYYENIGNISIAYFDLWAWLHFAANPISNISRFVKKENLNQAISVSMFNKNSTGKLECPFPVLYNVFLLEDLFRSSNRGLSTFGKNTSGNETQIQYVRKVFRQISELGNKIVKEQYNRFIFGNKCLRRDSESAQDTIINNCIIKKIEGDSAALLVNALFPEKNNKYLDEGASILSQFTQTLDQEVGVLDEGRQTPKKHISEMSKGLFNNLKWQNEYFNKIRQKPQSKRYTPRRHADWIHDKFMEFFEPEEVTRFENALANIKVDEHKPSFRTEIGNVIYDISNRLIKEYRDYQKQIDSF